MIKISSVVTEIVLGSEFATKGLQIGCLNLSAYAQRILPIVEMRAQKTATKSSIVITLSRLGKQMYGDDSKIPKIRFQNLSTSAGLVELSFGASADVRRRAMAMRGSSDFDGEHFIAVSFGLSETTIIASETDRDYILKDMLPNKPRSVVGGLGAIRAHIDKKTYNTPNILYSLFRTMARAEINLQSFNATFSEMTFIVNEADVKTTFLLLHDNYLAPNPMAKHR